MTATRHKACPFPYQELYIYLIKGMVRQDDEASLGDHFLGNWVEEESSFLFFSRPSNRFITRLLNARPDLELDDNYHFSYDAWQGGGLDPLEIGEFLIVPPWLESDHKEGLIKILLDPGVVFGNCLHPTTRDCLKALSLTAKQAPLGRVLDVGTGTGILAIAAARLGAETVLAVDLNPLCVKTANKNIEMNDLQEIIHVRGAKAEELTHDPADMILANIHYDVIKRFLKKGRFQDNVNLIISGLMRSQYRDVKTQLEQRGFNLLCEWDHEMTWFTVLASRGKALS
ncbi:MAG: 50S ribosomal protein L11 methyltransferase [Deltaproteobacteria bacterium]|nr:50S ribosomal protein L11 methyltransferase [Deltaproteobacteria bacterium]